MTEMNPQKSKGKENHIARYTRTLLFLLFIVATLLSLLSTLLPSHNTISNQREHRTLETATQQKKESPRYQYPEPPMKEKDNIGASHILPQGKIDVYIPTSLAIGDSTVAWNSGKKIDKPLVHCGTEKGTWADTLGMGVIACPGRTTHSTTSSIKKYRTVIASSSTIFITTGSNDIREKKHNELDKALDELVRTIRDINKFSRIIFVGYLPSYVNKKCMNNTERDISKELHYYHYRANNAMKDAALRNKVYYIDNFHSPYDICDKKNSYVRISNNNGEKLPLWHTTQKGHLHIARTISSVSKISHKG